MRHALWHSGLFAFCALSAWSAPLGAQDTVTVGVGSELSAPLLEPFRVPIVADMRKAGTNRLGSYTLRVSWNPNILYYVGHQSGTFAEPLVRTDSAYGYGVLWVTAISAAGESGVVELLNLTLGADSSDTDTIRVQVTELSAAGTPVNLLGAVVPQRGTFCPALGRWGDLDKDKRANSRDALAILTNLVGMPVPPDTFNLTLGDVDGDAKVNSRDALILLSYGVGIEIPGQRVLLIAGGLCASGRVPQLVVVPDTADLVVGQRVKLFAFGRDASGNLTAFNNLTWAVTDPTIAVIDGDGLLVARQPGTTSVTAAIGPGAQVQATVISRARRPVWYVAAGKAKQAPVQLGTVRWPFSTPQRTFPHLTEGDTIRIAPGTHDYEDLSYCLEGYCYYNNELFRGVVIVGDTLPDGTRPILRARPQDGETGFNWQRGGHAELRNLVLDGFYYAAYVDGVQTLVVENVRVQHPPTGYYYYYGSAVYVPGLVDTLRVRRAEFVMDTTRYYGYGIYVRGARLVEIHDSKVSNWGYGGFYGYDVDSLAVLRSEFSRNNSYGIYLTTWNRAHVNARISSSRFLDNYYEAIYINNGRTVALDHNYILQKRYNGIGAYGTSTVIAASPGMPAPSAAGPTAAAAVLSGTKLTMRGDSIQFRSNGWNWMYTSNLDSLLIDSLWVESPADTAINQYSDLRANYGRVTNSKWLNLNSEGIDFYGRVLVVDNSDFTTCNQPTCDWFDATAISARAYTDSGPAVTLTNSRFRNLYYALWSYVTATKAGPMLLSGNTADSVSYGFYLSADSVVAQDNVLRKVQYYGLHAQPSFSNRPFKTAVALRNQITCALTAGTSWGISVYYAPGLFEDNTITDCERGIYGYNFSAYPLAAFTARRNGVASDTTRTLATYGIWPDGWWRVALYGNRVRDGAYGLYLVTSDTAAIQVDSNAVSQTRTAGMYISVSSAPVTGVKNNFVNNVLDGVLNFGTGTRSFRLGRFVGNGRYAINSSAAFAADSNWWGHATGPGGSKGSGSTLADSVSSTAVTTSPFRDTDPTDVPAPLPAPPALGAAIRAFTPASGAPAARGVSVPPDLDAVTRAYLDARARQEAALAERQAERLAEWAARQRHLEAERVRIDQLRAERRSLKRPN